MAINQNFADCSDKWLLKLNASKCKSVYYGRDINHNLHYTQLENVIVIKDLGVYFDPDLSFVLHCQGERERERERFLFAGNQK